jgi:hypothetical protein
VCVRLKFSLLLKLRPLAGTRVPRGGLCAVPDRFRARFDSLHRLQPQPQRQLVLDGCCECDLWPRAPPRSLCRRHLVAHTWPCTQFPLKFHKLTHESFEINIFCYHGGCFPQLLVLLVPSTLLYLVAALLVLVTVVMRNVGYKVYEDEYTTRITTAVRV